MPTITAFPDIPRAYVRVEINWADVPSVTHARVLRVDSVTGECVPLRPYVCYEGDYLTLSCGHGIFWDTEVPLDRSVYYITDALNAPCIPDDSGVFDLYDRIIAATWGTSSSGDLWTTTGGAAADYSANGNTGLMSLGTVNVARHGFIGPNLFNANELVDVAPQQLATGAPIQLGAVLRATSVNDFYLAEIQFETTSLVTIRLRKNVAGVFTTLASFLTVYTYVAASVFMLRFQIVTNTLYMKIWPTTSAEPADWTLTVDDSSLVAAGQGGIRSVLAAGNTNVAPVASFDNFSFGEDCLPCTEVEGVSDPPLTVASDGAFRLKDPVRPCSDLKIPLCFDQVQQDPACAPGSGIFFGGVGREERAANSITLNPTNAALPLSVSRRRRGISSILTLVSRTFSDRDDLVAINDPGSPLLLQGPPQYGVVDQYIGVGDWGVDRGLTDHRFPIRVNVLPYVQVKRPAGPSLGVCGSRMQDLCDVYDTWTQIAEAELAWDDLIRGAASQDGGPVVADARTWDDVNTEFTDWNDVNTGGRTWADLQAGD